MKKLPVVLTAIALAVAGCVLLFTSDPAAAFGTLLLANAPMAVELKALERAFSDHGLKLTEFMERQSEKMQEFMNRLQDVEQKGGRTPGGGGDGDGAIAEMARLIVESEHTRAFVKGATPSTRIEIPRAQYKAAIVNATGSGQPLVAADRRPGIVTAPQRRFTIRDLFSQIRTASNLVEYVRELVYTNNAGPQYDGTSPAPQTEGVVKNESGITFELEQAAVVTIAHHITASRQVLSDAPMLERYLNDRLLYGVKIEEEDEILNGDGTGAQLNGLINQATAFTGGATNQSALDTLALSIAQLAVGDYMASGFILNPMDWWSSAIRLKKNSQGDYILGDPQAMGEPRLWGLPCVITNTMPAGSFVTLDAPRTGYVADREDANVRMSDQHADNFTRNLVTILCEERLSLIVEQPRAIIHGSLSYAG